MRHIYDDPAAYVDKAHPDIRIAEVNVKSHRLLFGRDAKHLDASRYFGANLS